MRSSPLSTVGTRCCDQRRGNLDIEAQTAAAHPASLSPTPLSSASRRLGSCGGRLRPISKPNGRIPFGPSCTTIRGTTSATSAATLKQMRSAPSKASAKSSVVNRHVVLDSFLFDDGWDGAAHPWEFNAGFPEGFRRIRAAAESLAPNPACGSLRGAAAERRARRVSPPQRQPDMKSTRKACAVRTEILRALPRSEQSGCCSHLASINSSSTAPEAPIR